MTSSTTRCVALEKLPYFLSLGYLICKMETYFHCWGCCEGYST